MLSCSVANKSTKKTVSKAKKTYIPKIHSSLPCKRVFCRKNSIQMIQKQHFFLLQMLF